MKIQFFIWLSLILLIFNYKVTAQKSEKSANLYKYLKLNVEFRKFDSMNFSLGNWQPAFALVRNRNFHELGLTKLTFYKNRPIPEYYIRVFNPGVRYLFKYQLFNKFFNIIPYIGFSFEGEYYSSHGEPLKPDVHKEFYSKVFACTLIANASLSYRISDKFLIDVDFPFPFWKGEFYRQRDILPITKERRILSGQEFEHPPNYYFNFRLGARYRMDYK